MLCTPLSPNCSSCLVSAPCSALTESKNNPSALVTDYPTKVAKVKQRQDFSAISVVELVEGEEGKVNTCDTGSKFLLVKRPEGGLLAGTFGDDLALNLGVSRLRKDTLLGELVLCSVRTSLDDAVSVGIAYAW